MNSRIHNFRAHQTFILICVLCKVKKLRFCSLPLGDLYFFILSKMLNKISRFHHSMSNINMTVKSFSQWLWIIGKNEVTKSLRLHPPPLPPRLPTGVADQSCRPRLPTEVDDIINLKIKNNSQQLSIERIITECSKTI